VLFSSRSYRSRMQYEDQQKLIDLQQRLDAVKEKLVSWR
jgi:hypothetical protein